MRLNQSVGFRTLVDCNGPEAAIEQRMPGDRFRPFGADVNVTQMPTVDPRTIAGRHPTPSNDFRDIASAKCIV